MWRSIVITPLDSIPWPTQFKNTKRRRDDQHKGIWHNDTKHNGIQQNNKKMRHSV
jgi:hypothetical protein